MPREKKNYIPLSMKVDAKIMERFNAYCIEVGQTKTLAFERIITEHLDRYEERKEKLSNTVTMEIH